MAPTSWDILYILKHLEEAISLFFERNGEKIDKNSSGSDSVVNNLVLGLGGAYDWLKSSDTSLSISGL
jgi:hypothetical protein